MGQTRSPTAHSLTSEPHSTISPAPSEPKTNGNFWRGLYSPRAIITSRALSDAACTRIKHLLRPAARLGALFHAQVLEAEPTI